MSKFILKLWKNEGPQGQIKGLWHKLHARNIWLYVWKTPQICCFNLVLTFWEPNSSSSRESRISGPTGHFSVKYIVMSFAKPAMLPGEDNRDWWSLWLVPGEVCYDFVPAPPPSRWGEGSAYYINPQKLTWTTPPKLPLCIWGFP